MDSPLEFGNISKDEVRLQLSALGFSNVPDDILQEFVMDIQNIKPKDFGKAIYLEQRTQTNQPLSAPRPQSILKSSAPPQQQSSAHQYNRNAEPISFQHQNNTNPNHFPTANSSHPQSRSPLFERNGTPKQIILNQPPSTNGYSEDRVRYSQNTHYSSLETQPPQRVRRDPPTNFTNEEQIRIENSSKVQKNGENDSDSDGYSSSSSSYCSTCEEREESRKLEYRVPTSVSSLNHLPTNKINRNDNKTKQNNTNNPQYYENGNYSNNNKPTAIPRKTASTVAAGKEEDESYSSYYDDQYDDEEDNDSDTDSVASRRSTSSTGSNMSSISSISMRSSNGRFPLHPHITNSMYNGYDYTPNFFINTKSGKTNNYNNNTNHNCNNDCS